MVMQTIISIWVLLLLFKEEGKRKRLSFLLKCHRNKRVAKESWMLHRLHMYICPVTFPFAGLHIAKIDRI